MENYRDIIEKLKVEYAERNAFMEVVDGNIIGYTFTKLWNDVRSVATYIMQNGINQKTVAIIGDNSYKWLVCAYACLYTDTAVFPMNPHLEEDSIIQLCKKVNVGFVFADKEFIARSKDEICKAIDVKIVEMQEPFSTEDDIESYNITFDSNKVKCYMASSGTTGKEKIVMFNDTNIYAQLKRGWPKAVAKDEIRMLWTLPLFHIGFFSIICALIGGDTLCIGGSPKYYFRDMKLFEPHEIAVVPMLADAISRKIERGISLRKIVGNNCFCISCGAAALSKKTINTIISENIFMVNSYGMTETSGMSVTILMNKENYSKFGSVGKPSELLNVKIADDGEILFSGEGVMLGYFDDEELTKQTIKDGWLYTGDLGYFDEDGYLFVKGRKKNVIVTSSGENILPEEIEKIFLEQEIVEEVCVYSVENVLTAEFYIGSKKTDKEVIEEAVKKYNKDSVASKNIRSIKYREVPFERTATGKIKRNFK